MKERIKINVVMIAIAVALCLALTAGTLYLGNTVAYADGTDGQAPTIVSVCGVPIDPYFTNLPTAVVGEEYKAPNGENYKVIATGTGPLTYFAYEYDSGVYNSLPKGLHLDSTTGEIYGTPEEAGLGDITIYVSNEYGGVNKVCSLRRFDADDKLTITTASLPNGAVGSTYHQEISYSGYSTMSPTCEVASGNLPNGLTFGNQFGDPTVYGTPTESGTFTFTLSVNNSAGTATKEYTIEIKNETVAPSFMRNATIINEEDKYSFVDSSGYIHVVKGKPVSVQLVSSGTNTPDNPIKYSLTASLPEGLTLSESGLITGTPADSIDIPYGLSYFYGGIKLENKTAFGDIKSSTAALNIVVCQNGFVQEINLSPDTTSVPKGGTRQFEIDWIGVGDIEKTGIEWVVWLKTSSDTTISDTGLLTVGLDETATTLQIRAEHSSGRISDAYVTVVDHTHTTTVVEAVPKSCTTDGNIKHYKCTICDELFSDALATQTLTAEQVKVSAGHEYGTLIPVQNANCMNRGFEAHYECSVCHLLFNASHEQKSATELEFAIDPTAHKFGTMTNEVPANCATEGVKAHKDCEYCNKHFDIVGAEIADLTIEKNDNHQTQSTWSKDGSGHWHACTRAGCKDYGKLDFAAHTPSATEATETVDVHCTICEYIIEAVKGHTHNLNLVAGHSNACYLDGAKTYYVCSEGDYPCGRYFEDSEGNTEITENIETWKIIPAGHFFGNWIDEVPATVDNFGVKAHKDCTVCNKHFDTDGNEQTEEDLRIEKLTAPSTPVTPEDPDESTPSDEPIVDGDVLNEEQNGSLSGGAIAGVVIGSVAVAGIGGFALFWFVIKKKKFADLIAIFKNISKK